jgi:two-component system OmpR family sensor kinase
LKLFNRLKGIRKRWMLNSVLVVLIVVVFSIFAFSVGVSSYFYSSIRTSLHTTASTSTDFFNNYITSSYSEYYQSAYHFTETFESRDKLELQFINTSGRIVISTYGLTAGMNPGTPDITGAIDSGEVSLWTGYDPNTGEHIMAVSSPLVFAKDQVIGVMRYVTSLSRADRQILISVLIASAAGALVMIIVIIPSSLFIRSIVEPVVEITDIAKRIAAGSYGVRIEKVYNDEIGELASTINEMSINLRHSETMTTDFISSVSHELRTPLTAITGWGETLVSGDLKNTDEIGRGIRIMLNEARRLTGMVEELLEFTRMETGRFKLTIKQTDVRAVLEDTVFTYGELLRRDGIELNYDDECPESMPPVQGDGQRLKQVFLNILDNAAKHGREGKRIDVSISVEQTNIVVRIRDFGPGIPEDELPNVKYKFYKGRSKERGSGIGLAVCEEIVTMHGGRLVIANAEGGGCIVSVYLPISVAAPETQN